MAVLYELLASSAGRGAEQAAAGDAAPAVRDQDAGGALMALEQGEQTVEAGRRG